MAHGPNLAHCVFFTILSGWEEKKSKGGFLIFENYINPNFGVH